ncbi:DUF411 domain-containing protein [Marinobacter zhanjiangensis]|uniref:CopG protein n=1 Tax=Marinobacter zhanjiangensis TaxID=578215 RepID=A0ABQ3ANA4_9GAMM|nr:DUF411 domain-containing protein [Marinobacter zhanjiangensis]GGY60430.1 hypothetical protein GCM10007071_03840 [Marinobacter zhanjiangensis]
MKTQATLGLVALVIGVTAIGFKLQAAESTPSQAVSAPADRIITVHKSPSCGCCGGWIEHLEQNGFDVKVENTDNINDIKIEHQVPRDLASCHTALIDGAVIEGHVEATDIVDYVESETRPFGERTIGIAVPGMPHGVPGMETGRQDSYDVMAFAAGGRAESVKRYEY